MYTGIHCLDPTAYFYQLSTVDRIAIIATKRDLAHGSDGLLSQLSLEKIQRELAIQQAVRYFGPWASRTPQGTDTGRFDMPMVPDDQANSISVL